MTVWLSCKDRKDWSFETISELMLKDSIDRNVRKLQKLKQKITLLQVPRSSSSSSSLSGAVACVWSLD
jgi:hypothetical protein